MKIKEIYTKYKKKSLITALGLATISGTWGGNEVGCSPVLNRKVEKSYGLVLDLLMTFYQNQNSMELPLEY